MYTKSLQSCYDNFQEFESYDNIFSLADRLRFKGELIDLWNMNPVIQGGVNPSDYKMVTHVTYKLKGTRLASPAIGKAEKFIIQVSKYDSTFKPLDAMKTSRESMYNDGYDKILFKVCMIKNGSHFEEIPMLQALNLE